MKSLSLQRPLAIIVIGLPGSGKSYFAEQFSSMFNAPIVSFDRLHYRLFTHPTYKFDETNIVLDVMRISIEELLKTQKVIIIDGGHNSRVARAELQAALKKSGYDSLMVWVQTDETTSKRRSIKRSHKDAHNRPLTAEQFETLKRKMTTPNHRDNYVVISGKHLFGSQAKAVLKRLVAPRQDIIAPPQRTPSRHGSGSASTTRRNVVIS